jgi:hypothetical protein
LGAAVETTTPVIFGQRGGVSSSKPKTGLAFPFVLEAVDLVQFDGSIRVDEVSEHPSTSYGGELAGVADENESPILLISQSEQFAEFGGGGGGGFVDDHRRPCTQVKSGVRWPRRIRVFDQQLVQCVGRHVGFGSEDLGCGRGWSNPVDGTIVEAKVGSGFGQHRGLPRTSRTHNQLETAIACNGGGGVLLSRGEMIHEVEAPTTLRTAVDAMLRPSEQLFLLIEN